MKIKEAIENLRFLNSDECTDSHTDYREEINMAISALEKQLPMEPKISWSDSGFFVNDVCPCCGRTLISMNVRNRRYVRKLLMYCPECKQKINWSKWGR